MMQCIKPSLENGNTWLPDVTPIHFAAVRE